MKIKSLCVWIVFKNTDDIRVVYQLLFINMTTVNTYRVSLIERLIHSFPIRSVIIKYNIK